MRFLVDAQLPPALARAIEGQGHCAEHVADVGLLCADDESIWTYAGANRAVILTKDEDFVWRHHKGDPSVIVVWLRQGNASRQALLRWFMPLLPRVTELIEAGETLVEIR